MQFDKLDFNILVNLYMNGINYIILLRIDQRAESRKERADIRSAQTEWKRQERQKQIEQGKKPFFRRQVNRLPQICNPSYNFFSVGYCKRT